MTFLSNVHNLLPHQRHSVNYVATLKAQPQLTYNPPDPAGNLTHPIIPVVAFCTTANATLRYTLDGSVFVFHFSTRFLQLPGAIGIHDGAAVEASTHVLPYCASRVSILLPLSS
jgi:hypothetical protein